VISGGSSINFISCCCGITPTASVVCDADESWLWALLELVPTSQRGGQLTVARLKRLLLRHRIRRWTAEQVREVLGPCTIGLASACSMTRAVSSTTPDFAKPGTLMGVRSAGLQTVSGQC